VVQGHGDIILRGEIEAAVKENLAYLSAIRKAVRAAAKRKSGAEYLDEITIEDCGKSRVHMGGLSLGLHERNVRSLYKQMLDKKDVEDPEAE
jgi:cyclase